MTTAPGDVDHPVTGLESASWIWDAGDPAPRNAWRLFRRTFDVLGAPAKAQLRITADTRYVLHVNGERVGQGPARGFPDHYFVDTWDVTPLILPGATNVIAVQVLHFGVATFQSLATRGGVIADLTLDDDQVLVTDDTWRVSSPAGVEPRSNRMSCQLGFVEFVDAREFPLEWTRPEFDDSRWELATPIGPIGTAPWTKLVSRDIPHLQEQAIRPARVERMANVRPIAESCVIDMRCHMDPKATTHANQVSYAGYLVTTIRVREPGEVTIIFAWDRVNSVSIDGAWVSHDDLVVGPDEQRSLTLSLAEGDHLFVADVSAMDHGHGFRVALDGPATFVPAIPGETPFATIGPIGESPDPDAVFPPVPAIPADIQSQVRSLTRPEDLSSVSEYLKPVDAALVSPVDLFTLSTRPSAREEMPVLATLQGIVSGQPATVPLSADTDTELIFDMGRELSGYVYLDIEAPEGVMVDLFGFEYLRGDHRENPSLLDNSLRYITRAGRQRYVSATRRGLRHLQVTVRPGKATGDIVLHDIGMIESHYPVSRVGSFRSSDPLLEDIYEMCRRTVLACMEDTWVDCPAFEQTYWVGDAYNTARFATWLFGAEPLTERCIRLVTGSKDQTPKLASQVPSGWVNVLPNWTFFWAMTAREHWFRTADEAFAVDLWPSVRDALDAFLAHIDARGLLSIEAWNLLDWAPIDQPNSGVVTHQNCIFVLALRSAADLADASGDTEGARRFRDAADALARAIDKHLWSDEADAYIDAIHADGRRSGTISVHSQMFALYANVPGKERRGHVQRQLLDPPASWVRISSPWMSAFLYDMLADNGHTEHALAHIRENYGRMLEHDATTCWEMYPESNFVSGSGRLSRSHCHAWSAAPARFLPQRILGIQPLDPGWTRIAVSPEPCGLTWAEGRVPLPDEGWIDVSWRIDEAGEMILDVSAPDGVEIVQRIPAQM